MDSIIRVIVKRTLDKLELVDRVEFDAQCEALDKAIKRAQELEIEMMELRKKIDQQSSSED